MDAVSKTLYIPLYGKALVSRMGRILSDPKAEEIWACAGFPLKGKAASKWLAYYMGMRSAVFDRWVTEKIAENPGACVLHLGCGLDSRCRRVKTDASWFDVDFPAVIEERKRYFPESGNYRMIGRDLREDFLRDIPRGGSAIVVMEGISMYLNSQERLELLRRLASHFSEVRLLLDSYTVFAAKATKYKNPINDVGVTQVYGFDDPRELACGSLTFLAEHDMNPPELVEQLPQKDQRIYRLVYGGKMARKICRLYEYRSPGL
jgi:O-methyltransferase involved in polyketide biosynthesis